MLTADHAGCTAWGGRLSSYVQVAELNAINANLAVIRWKRYLGFYATHETTNLTVYKLYLSELQNGEVA